MKIIVDDKIPYIREALSGITHDTLYIKGADISAEDVREADALIVRTRTRCDRRLLEGSKVRFVATATIGIDHLDTDYLDRAGIRWMNCPGCNAASVGQYIETALISMKRDFGFDTAKATLGIVGYGHVGHEVKKVAEKMGMNILVNDPFLDDDTLVTLNEICRKADIITFHVPLTYDGTHPTFHLANSRFMNDIGQRGVTIINTSRGGVIDEKALLHAMDDGIVAHAIIDTWEGEPNINPELLRRAYIATPHIAGYSADGKVNADNMVIEALCKFFGMDNPGIITPPQLPAGFHYNGDPLELYNPLYDSQLLKAHPEAFEEQRGNYHLLREKC